MENSLLTETVDAAGVAPMPNGSAASYKPLVPDAATLAVDPAEEYLSGGAYSSALGFARSLPDYIDDASRDFGADLYERMELDAHIAGELNAYKLSVLANGWRLLPSHPTPAPGDVEAERLHKIACTVMDFCQSALDELDTPLNTVLWDKMRAFSLGNRVSELVYRRDGKYLMPFRIKPKPRTSTAFVMDSRENVIGLLGAIAGQSQTVVQPGIIVDPAQTANLLPRRKFAVLTWRPQNCDPRGTSVLRACYNAWWQKRQTEVELCKYIAQFAGAAIFATTAEGAKPVPAMNPDGTVRTNADGSMVLLHPQSALASALLAYKNGGVFVGPHGTDIKNLVTVGAGQPFFEKLDYCNKEISKAILSQTLATNEGKHQTRAASGGQKDVMDLLVQEGEGYVASMLRRDVLKQVVLLNFGPKYLPFVPFVTLSAVEESDFAALATAYSTVGYMVAPEQLPEIDSKLGLTPRENVEDVETAPGQTDDKTGKEPDETGKKAKFTTPAKKWWPFPAK